MAENLFDLTGKVALVTGANSGLGLAMAEGLARAGADVVIWGRREDRNAIAAEQLKAHGGRVAHRAVDVSDEQAVAAAFAAALEEFGRVDCVIANAGVANMAPIDQMTTEVWNGLLGANLHGVFYTLREAARHMKARAAAGDPGGSIIVNGSLAVFSGVPGMTHYAAAKGGINSLSKTLAVELGASKVRVNTICPGYIPTHDYPEGTNPLIGATIALSPIKQIGRPEDLQGIVVYLASDMSRYHTGDTITLDGGMMIQTYPAETLS
jgi:NAD(P)-dependent dehydrogenase (short-subunit alcohol dehydrogenase family)